MTEFRKGIITAITLYGIGCVITLVSYYLIPWPALEGPSMSFMVLLFFVLIALYRLFKTAYNVIRLREKDRNKGEMITHMVFFAGVVLIIFMTVDNA